MIGLLSTRVGLDPGTANTLVYVKGRGVAVNEPSLVTVRTSSGQIEAVGSEAEAGRGRTPRKFQTARPLRAGIINDFKLFDGMLHRFLRKAHITGPLHRLKVAIAVPTGMTEGERVAVIESIQNAGAVDILLVNQALAAARGAGVRMEESRGRLVVNIGAGVTGVAVDLARELRLRALDPRCRRRYGCRYRGARTDRSPTRHRRAYGRAAQDPDRVRDFHGPGAYFGCEGPLRDGWHPSAK